MLRRVPAASLARRYLNAEAVQHSNPEKRFVRIAGPASYASREDIELFLKNHGIEKTPIPSAHTSKPAPAVHYELQQGQSDIFQNHSIWLLNAGTQERAKDVSAKISGKVAGLKLVRAAAVDERLVNDMTGADQGRNRRMTLRKRMNIISPKPEERGRSLLATNLPIGMPPRMLWSFFGPYEVEDVRHLRKSGVASIVFSTSDEAYRALRERANLRIHNNNPCGLKMHE